MSAGAQVRLKRARTRGDAELKRPADEPANSPAPRYSWLQQHLVYPTIALVLRAIDTLKPVDLAGGVRGEGRMLDDSRSERIAAATAQLTHDKRPLPARTVRYAIARANEKGITEFVGSRHLNDPRGRCLRLIPYGETLRRVRANPDNAVTHNGAFYTCGKARNVASRERVLKWGVKLDEAAPAGALVQVTQPEPVDLGDQVARSSPAAKPAILTPADTLAAITEALDDATTGVTEKDASGLYSAVLDQFGRHAPPSDVIADTIRAIHQSQPGRASGSAPRPLSLRRLRAELFRRLNKWRRNQRKANRRAAFERDDQINQAALALRELESQDLPPPQREAIEGLLASIDPDIVGAARRLLIES